jgi:hypothetical protein
MTLGDPDLKVKLPRVFSEAQKRAQFQPGEVRNARGRPRKTHTADEIRAREAKNSARAAAKEHTQEAIDTLVEIMRNKDVKPAVRVTASALLLDRGHGKATQVIENKADIYDRMSDIELISFILGKPVEELQDIQEARENHLLELEASGADPDTFE